jgi:hypothetical protein
MSSVCEVNSKKLLESSINLNESLLTTGIVISSIPPIPVSVGSVDISGVDTTDNALNVIITNPYLITVPQTTNPDNQGVPLHSDFSNNLLVNINGVDIIDNALNVFLTNTVIDISGAIFTDADELIVYSDISGATFTDDGKLIVCADISGATFTIDGALNVNIVPPTNSVTSLYDISNIGQTISASPSKLISILITNSGTSGTAFFKIYNVALPTSTDTPVMTFPVSHDTTLSIPCNHLSFATAIGVRASSAYASADTGTPNGIQYLTAFYT